MTKTTYKVEELFEDIEGDPDNVIFKIPPEILESTGWKTSIRAGLNISMHLELLVHR